MKFIIEAAIHQKFIFPNEKAFLYKIRLEAMIRLEQRTDLTSEPLAGKLKGIESAEEIDFPPRG